MTTLKASKDLFYTKFPRLEKSATTLSSTNSSQQQQQQQYYPKITLTSQMKRMSFTPLPKESFEAHLSRKFYQLVQDEQQNDAINFLRQNKSAKSLNRSMNSFFQDECNASELSKADIHRKIIGMVKLYKNCTIVIKS